MPTDIHRHAHSYDGAADAYEQGRPEYPAKAVAHVVRTLGLGPGRTVVDLAAGTGKFTRRLVPCGATVIAVEPVAGMRAKLAAGSSGIQVLEGTAEGIPLPDAAADALTVAQAFHWFRGTEALAEIRRVLKPAAGLALVWNVRDESVDVFRRLSELMDPHGGGAPRYHTGLWREAFARPNGFTPLSLVTFPFHQEVTLEQAVARASSTSFVAGLPGQDRARLLDEVRALMRSHLAGPGQGRIVFPYVTEVYACWKE